MKNIAYIEIDYHLKSLTIAVMIEGQNPFHDVTGNEKRALYFHIQPYPATRKNMIKVPHYSLIVIVAIFQMCKYEERITLSLNHTTWIRDDSQLPLCNMSDKHND